MVTGGVLICFLTGMCHKGSPKVGSRERIFLEK